MSYLLQKGQNDFTNLAEIIKTVEALSTSSAKLADVETPDNNGANDEEMYLAQLLSPSKQTSMRINMREIITKLTCKICFSAEVGIFFIP